MPIEYKTPQLILRTTMPCYSRIVEKKLRFPKTFNRFLGAVFFSIGSSVARILFEILLNLLASSPVMYTYFILDLTGLAYFEKPHSLEVNFIQF